MNVREAVPDDSAEWLRMRRTLWPDESVASEVAEYFRERSPLLAVVFVAERSEGGLAGFLELGLRPYAEGCESTPVPFIEGWYVDSDVRESGIGRALVKAAETWAASRGFREIASDVEIDNAISISAHRALGYEEVTRLVCFHRRLVDDSHS